MTAAVHARHIPLLALAALVALSVASALPAAAAKGYPADVIRKCRGDYKRLCPGYKINSPTLDACMRSKHPLITNSCMNSLVDNGIAPPIARRR